MEDLKDREQCRKYVEDGRELSLYIGFVQAGIATSKQPYQPVIKNDYDACSTVSRQNLIRMRHVRIPLFIASHLPITEGNLEGSTQLCCSQRIRQDVVAFGIGR